MAFIKSDYHMHTPLCGHAKGEPYEYVEAAIAHGLDEIGFSDHAPFVHTVDPAITMGREQLPLYLRLIEEVRDKYQDKIRVKVALEVDFIEGYEEQTRAMLGDYPYDYLIGSVHYIGDFGFDDPAQKKAWESQDVNAVYRDYFELLRKSARTGFFQIIGHCDLVKKFGHRATEDMQSEIEACAKVFKEMDVAIEINTAGLRKPVKEIYPSLEYLKIYQEVGVRLTFGSDAHVPKHVGCDYDKALKLAKAAGYTEYVTFKNGQIEDAFGL